MKINKALVKHETRNMKWMLLYFLTVVIGGLLSFNSNLNGGYINFLTNSISPDNTGVLYSLRTLLSDIIVVVGVGILIMIYLQFKDSKSVEVGNFLKALPISNREYYFTKFMGGLISLTIPTMILIAGILAIRSSHMQWISDIHLLSAFPELVMKSDSMINITAVLIMSYLVAVSTYAFLFIVQYIVMNITAGLLIGSLIWLSPVYIIGSIGVIYSKTIEKLFIVNSSREVLFKLEESVFNYIQPWTYPVNISNLSTLNKVDYNPMFDYGQFLYFEGVGIKIIITLAITVGSIALGYLLSNKSKVEDNDALISFKWARYLFVVGVTICSSLLLADIAIILFGMYDSIGYLVLHITMLIGGVLGYIISRKMTRIKNK